MDEDSVPGTLFAFSPKGWIDTELFENWFFHHFLVYAPPVRPLLLLLDGHSSHYSPQLVNKAAEEKAWARAMTPSNIMAGFKITGVYPVNCFALIPPETALS